MPRRIVTILVVCVVVVPAGGSIAAWRLGGLDGVQRLAIRRILQGQRPSLFEDGRLHVFTLGTGSPQLGGSRMPAANAVPFGRSSRDRRPLVDLRPSAWDSIAGRYDRE